MCQTEIPCRLLYRSMRWRWPSLARLRAGRAGGGTTAKASSASAPGWTPLPKEGICYLAAVEGSMLQTQLPIPLLITLLAPCLLAERPAAGVEQSLRQARQKLKAAQRAADAAQIEQFLADDFFGARGVWRHARQGYIRKELPKGSAENRSSAGRS